MAASLVTAVSFPLLLPGFTFAQATILQVMVTTLCWLVPAFLGPQIDRSQLIEFYKKVHPSGPGWTKIRREAGMTAETAALHGDHMGMATAGWVSGCLVIWPSLFAIGNLLYGRMALVWTLTPVVIASGIVLLYVINHLWDKHK